MMCALLSACAALSVMSHTHAFLQDVFKECKKLFAALPLAAIVAGKTLVLHGGNTLPITPCEAVLQFTVTPGLSVLPPVMMLSVRCSLHAKVLQSLIQACFCTCCSNGYLLQCSKLVKQ